MSLTTTNPIINIPQIDMFSQQWSIKNEEKKIEWNLSKLKLIYTSFCIQNRQMLGIYSYITNIPSIGTLFTVWHIQDFGLSSV